MKRIGFLYATLIALVVALVLALMGCGAPAPEEVQGPADLANSYQCDVYTEAGCAKFVVASGGEIEVQSGGTVDFQSGSTVGLVNATASGTITAADLVATDDIDAGDDIRVDGSVTVTETVTAADLVATDDIDAGDDIRVDGSVTVTETVSAEQVTSTDDATVTDDLTVGGDADIDGTANLDEVDVDGVLNLITDTEHIGAWTIDAAAIITSTDGALWTIGDGEIWLVGGVFCHVTTNFACDGDDCTLQVGDGGDANGLLDLVDAELQASDTEMTGAPAGWQWGGSADTIGAYLAQGNAWVYAPSGAAETIDIDIEDTSGSTDPTAGAATCYLMYLRLQ